MCRRLINGKFGQKNRTSDVEKRSRLRDFYPVCRYVYDRTLLYVIPTPTSSVKNVRAPYGDRFSATTIHFNHRTPCTKLRYWRMRILVALCGTRASQNHLVVHSQPSKTSKMVSKVFRKDVVGIICDCV